MINDNNEPYRGLVNEMINNHDEQYRALLHRVLEHGVDKGDRTGTGTRSVFGERMVFDCSKSFPLLTLKRTPFRFLAEEMLWFISGDTNARTLSDKGIRIWEPWAGEDGELGPVYGAQWRRWPTTDRLTNESGHIDQLAEAERKLIFNPDDRRIIVSAWNVSSIEHMALPPCHLLFQFYSRPLPSTHDGPVPRRLDLQLYQRSCDLFIGVPFNVAQYALLLHLMAHAAGHEVGTLTWVGGDVHLYHNHLDAARSVLTRAPYLAPTLEVLGRSKKIDEYRFGDLALQGYKSHEKVAVDVSV